MSTLTPHDLKALETSTSKDMRVATHIAFPFCTLFLFASAAFSLYSCSRLSKLAGINLSETIQGWFAGIDVSKQYSGVYLAALQSWEQCIFHATMAVFAGIMFVSLRVVMNRNARILKFIKEHVPSLGSGMNP